MQLWGPSSLVLVGAALVAVGTWWSSQKQAALNQQIIGLQNDVIAFNKGADILDFQPKSGSADEIGKYVIVMFNMNKLPVYDAYINVRTNIDSGDLSKMEILHQEIGNVGPYIVKEIALKLPPGYYQIDLRCRGGKTTQMLHFIRKPGGGNPDFSILAH